jgi:riboflavin synthase
VFTGIVTEVGKVISLRSGVLTVAACSVLNAAELGGSMAVNGACLTITHFTANSFSVDLSPETLQRTNLGSLADGSPVNLERPLALGGELGGHLVQGHIDGTGRLVFIRPSGGSHVARLEAPPEIMRYVVEKAFIAVDGISLTVTSRGSGDFEVSIVDYTMHHTNLAQRKMGERVNLEVDIIAKYVERSIHSQHGAINQDFLRENGFA